MVRDELSVLPALLADAEDRSFTRAGKRLGVASSALSHAIRGLEDRIGVRLLARTTRSVAPTEAGDQLLARLRPAVGDIRGALDQVSGLRDQPAGRVRLCLSQLGAMVVPAAALGRLARGLADGAAAGERRADPGGRGLVSAVRRLFSLLPESTAAAGRALGSHRHPSSAAVVAGGNAWHSWFF